MNCIQCLLSNSFLRRYGKEELAGKLAMALQWKDYLGIN
jgi:hypothetical protein